MFVLLQLTPTIIMSLAGSTILDKGVTSDLSPKAFISQLNKDERRELGRQCIEEYLKPGSGEYTMSVPIKSTRHVKHADFIGTFVP